MCSLTLMHFSSSVAVSECIAVQTSIKTLSLRLESSVLEFLAATVIIVMIDFCDDWFLWADVGASGKVDSDHRLPSVAPKVWINKNLIYFFLFSLFFYFSFCRMKVFCCWSLGSVVFVAVWVFSFLSEEEEEEGHRPHHSSPPPPLISPLWSIMETDLFPPLRRQDADLCLDV